MSEARAARAARRADDYAKRWARAARLADIRGCRKGEPCWEGHVEDAFDAITHCELSEWEQGRLEAGDV